MLLERAERHLSLEKGVGLGVVLGIVLFASQGRSPGLDVPGSRVTSSHNSISESFFSHENPVNTGLPASTSGSLPNLGLT